MNYVYNEKRWYNFNFEIKLKQKKKKKEIQHWEHNKISKS